MAQHDTTRTRRPQPVVTVYTADNLAVSVPRTVVQRTGAGRWVRWDRRRECYATYATFAMVIQIAGASRS